MFLTSSSILIYLRFHPLQLSEKWYHIELFEIKKQNKELGNAKKHLTVQTGYAKISATSAPEKKMCA